MQFWFQAKYVSLCVLVTMSIPVPTMGQDLNEPTAYQVIQDTPFQRNHLPAMSAEALRLPRPDSMTKDTGGKVELIPDAATRPRNEVVHFIQPDETESGEIILAEVPVQHTRPAGSAESTQVIIHPPMIQPYKKNQYTFLIENLGQVAAEDISVELTVGPECRFVAVLPSQAVVTDHKALIKLDHLHSLEHRSIHITAVSDNPQPIKFQTKISHSSEQEFGATMGGEDIRLGAVGDHYQTPAAEYQVPIRPASTPSEVPIVPAPRKFESRPTFQPNPHFQASENSFTLPRGTSNAQSPFQSASVSRLTTSVGPVSNREVLSDNNFDFHPTTIRDLDQTEPYPMIDSLDSLPANDPVGQSDASIAYEQAPSPASSPSRIVLSKTTAFDGPRNMEPSEIREFSFTISNPVAKTTKNVLVNLTVPDGFEIVSFDRQTWYDEATRTISFRIAQLEPKAFETVHYELRALTSGFQIQKLMVESNELERNEVRFDTLVGE